MASRGGLSGNQSDEEQDIDIIESDEDDASSSYGSKDGCDPEDKKAHHNALERKRRDHIKESFVGLRDSLPNVKKEKVSRAQILQQATEYIQYMTKKNGSIQKDIDTMRRQNDELKIKVHQAEKSRSGVLQNSLNTPVLKEEVVEICDNSDVDLTYRNNKRLKVSPNNE